MLAPIARAGTFAGNAIGRGLTPLMIAISPDPLPFIAGRAAKAVVFGPPDGERDLGSTVQEAGTLADTVAAAQQTRFKKADVPFEVRPRANLAALLNPLEAKDIMGGNMNTALGRGLGQAKTQVGKGSGFIRSRRDVGKAFVDQTSKTGKAAKQAGLVASRPDQLTRRNFLKGVGESSRTLRRRGSVGTISTAVRNAKVAKAVQQAADAGEFGMEAMESIARQFPDSVAKQIAVPEKGLLPGEIKPRTGPTTKLGKTAGSLIKAAPVIGTAFDAANVYDEFTDPDSTMLEKAASVGDLALGLTGAPLVLDLWAGANNHDGFFAMLVGDKD